jgi:hypothetical protein
MNTLRWAVSLCWTVALPLTVAAQKRVVVTGASSAEVKELQAAAPLARIVSVSGDAEVRREIAEADGFIGSPTPELMRIGKKLRWVQVGSAGVDNPVALQMIGRSRGARKPQQKTVNSVNKQEESLDAVRPAQSEVLPATRQGQGIAGVPIDVHSVGSEGHLRKALFIGRLALARSAPVGAIISPEGSRRSPKIVVDEEILGNGISSGSWRR